MSNTNSMNFIYRSKGLKAFQIIVLISFMIPVFAQQAEEESAAWYRYRTQWNMTEDPDNEFYSKFMYSDAVGLGLTKGISRRDPTTILKVDETYYIWYTYSTGDGPIDKNKATEECFHEASPRIRNTSWDYGCIAWATSKDGFNWEEQGIALYPGPQGSFDCRSVFTPDVMFVNGKYYLYYQAEKSKDEIPIVIGMAWADSPEGPWTKLEKPIIQPDKGHSWCLDPNLIIRQGKYWLYYQSPGWRVAIASKPEGPFRKHEMNPVTNSGHEVFAWPYKEGVALLVTRNGPEKNTVQYAPDGLNFEVKSRITYPPNAAGGYIPDKYTNTKDGQGFTWGISHVMQDTEDHTEAYLVRFDCDLSQEVDWPLMKEYWVPSPGCLLFHERMRLEPGDRLKE